MRRLCLSLVLVLAAVVSAPARQAFPEVLALTNAEMLRLEKQIGAIEPGFEADLLVVDGNPLDNIRVLLDPLLVISNGRVGLDRLSFGK